MACDERVLWRELLGGNMNGMDISLQAWSERNAGEVGEGRVWVGGRIAHEQRWNEEGESKADGKLETQERALLVDGPPRMARQRGPSAAVRYSMRTRSAASPAVQHDGTSTHGYCHRAKPKPFAPPLPAKLSHFTLPTEKDGREMASARKTWNEPSRYDPSPAHVCRMKPESVDESPNTTVCGAQEVIQAGE